jgi:8-oxo-dGTP diphosphatase
MTRRGEAAWLEEYDPGDFPPFAVTVDVAIFTLRAGTFCTLLVKRGGFPYRGWWALPGGHVKHGSESADDAARRELEEETGIDAIATGAHLEQLATYSAPARDPRIRAGLHVVSIGYVALAPDLPEPIAGTDAAEARWVPVADLDELRLAFDHASILADAAERVRAKLEYTTLAAAFVREPFSLSDLRNVYLAVWGDAPDLANFRRKVLATPDFVRPATRAASAPTAAGGRPPELYRRGTAQLINPPLVRR